MRRVVFALHTLVCSISVFAASPALTVDSSAVSIANVRPGASVALAGVATIPKPLFPGGASYCRIVTDADGDGRIAFAPSDGVAWRSLWVAVDLDTGAYSIATPERYPARPMAAPQEVVRRGNFGQMNRWWHERAVLNLLVVRPGEGAWMLSASKGSNVDDDKQNHRPGFGTVLDSFSPVTGSTPAPKHFRRGDVIVALDPINLEYYVLALTQGE